MSLPPVRRKKKRKPCSKQGFLLSDAILDRPGNFTGAQTPGTNVHMAGGTIDDSLHALDVGLPSPVRTPVRVGNLNTKSNALVAELTLSHPLHLLAVHTMTLTFTSHIGYNSMSCRKMQELFCRCAKKFSFLFHGLHMLPVAECSAAALFIGRSCCAGPADPAASGLYKEYAVNHNAGEEGQYGCGEDHICPDQFLRPAHIVIDRG